MYHCSLKVGVEALIRGHSTSDTCLERGLGLGLLLHEIPEILWSLPEALMVNVNNQMSRRAEQQNSTGCLCN